MHISIYRDAHITNGNCEQSEGNICDKYIPVTSHLANRRTPTTAAQRLTFQESYLQKLKSGVTNPVEPAVTQNATF